MNTQTFKPNPNERFDDEAKASATQSRFVNQLLDATQQYVATMTEFTPLTAAEKLNMQDSAERMAKALGEMIFVKEKLVSDLGHILKDAFPIGLPKLPMRDIEQTPVILTESPIYASSLCPHHFLPVQYEVFIAIKIPAQGGSSVYGLSKYTRAVQALSKRPVLQEQYTRDIVELFVDGIIGGEIEIGNDTVAGCMVVVDGKHGCMQCRGVRSSTPTITTYARGMDDQDLKTAWELYRNGNGRNR